MIFPKISIVIPVLNRVTTVEKAIKSVVDQQYPNLELIIIDGGSTDGTIEIIEKYAEHITYWQSKKDNVGFAMNFGLQKATGELLALLMADDWYELGLLQMVADASHHHPEVDIISCGGRILCYDEQKKLYRTTLKYNTAKRVDLNFYNVCFGVSAICSRFIKKSLFDRIGYFITEDKAGKHLFTNDKEFLLRAILADVKQTFIPFLGHTYLASKASSTFGNHKENILRMCEEHKQMAEIYLQRADLTLGDRLFLHYWHIDQSTRLILYAILDKDFKTVAQQNMGGIKRYHIFWPFGVLVNTIKISLIRFVAWIKRSAIPEH